MRCFYCGAAVVAEAAIRGLLYGPHFSTAGTGPVNGTKKLTSGTKIICSIMIKHLKKLFHLNKPGLSLKMYFDLTANIVYFDQLSVAART